MLLVNFKTYSAGTGQAGVRLARVCASVAAQTGVKIAVAVQATDIRSVSDAVRIPVFAQHVDPVSAGPNTGYIMPEAIKAAGAVGSLLNHSEHRLPKAQLAMAVKRLRQTRLRSICFAASVREGRDISKLKPDYVVVEPPELIGGRISVSKARPSVISNAVKNIYTKRRIRVLVGAGVRSRADVGRALELGAAGVAVSSAVLKAARPNKVLYDLARGFDV